MDERKQYLATGYSFGFISFWCMIISVCLALFVLMNYGLAQALIILGIGLFFGILLIEAPVRFIFWQARQNGFDGVELLLTNRVINNILNKPDYYQQMAEQYGLEISYHQPWEALDIFGRVLILLGIMPSRDKMAARVIAVLKKGLKPIVIHSDLIQAIPPHFYSQCRVEPMSKDPIPPNVEIVFDCFYLLFGDYKNRRRQKLILKSDETVRRWQEALAGFGSRVTEFHIYDYDHQAGLMSKNRLPGSGELPLLFLKDLIYKQPVPAIIVLELNPLQLLFSFWSIGLQLRWALAYFQMQAQSIKDEA